MLTRRLGRTEHQSSLAVLGGAAYWGSEPDEVAASFEGALAAGVNHLDVAPQYGKAEVLLGPVLGPVRDQMFVGCKSLRHSRDGVRAQLEESLTKLHCDHFDLYQLHAVTDIDELDRRAGAAEALLEARDEGLCRWIGITGHEMTVPSSHLEALRRYDFDTVMFPVNPRLWADADYRADAEALLAVCARRDVGVMAIKAAARRPWGDEERFATTWYEPYDQVDAVERGVRFALSVDGVDAFCTPGDVAVLRLALDAAGGFTPMGADELEAAMVATTPEPLIFPMPRA
jgi:aryl-alcohol dehydrogenase-like predicted oxidoreductase